MDLRRLQTRIAEVLDRFRVVALVGARQVGKTTLAKAVQERPRGESVNLDLERPSNLAKLEEPELYFDMHWNALVILDETQRMPELLPPLRSPVDKGRRYGRFLILGNTPEATICLPKDDEGVSTIMSTEEPGLLMFLRVPGSSVHVLRTRASRHQPFASNPGERLAPPACSSPSQAHRP